MVEVMEKPRNLDEEPEEAEKGYDYQEPPRHTVLPDSLEPAKEEYPRLSSEVKYDYQEPPRESIQIPNPDSVHTENKIPILLDGPDESLISQRPIVTIEDQANLSLKDRIKQSKIPDNITIHTFILLLLGSQDLFLLAVLVSERVNNFFGFFDYYTFFTVNWWIFPTAIGVYMALYLSIWKWSARISKSASSFFLIMTGLACESVLLTYASLYIVSEFIISSFLQVLVCVYSTAILAQCLKNKYSGLIGRLVAAASSLVCLVFYLAFAYETMDIVLLAVITFAGSLYMWYIITEIDHFVENLGGADTMLAGIFCSLMVIKVKIDLILSIVVFPYTIYKITEGNASKKPKEMIEPLLPVDNNHNTKVG